MLRSPIRGREDRDSANSIPESKAQKKSESAIMIKSMMSSMKLFVLCLLCMQNTLFTVLRRYSQGVLKENYSKVSAFVHGLWCLRDHLRHHLNDVVAFFLFFHLMRSMKSSSSVKSLKLSIPDIRSPPH